jgi:hypothetical protein
VTSWALTVALIIAWAFPVAFVGTLSNLDDVCQQFRCVPVRARGALGLTRAQVAALGVPRCVGCAALRAGVADQCAAPKPVPGLLQGVLPPVLLALLFLVLPVLLRGLGWYENIPLRSLLSVSVYKRYYALLVMCVLRMRRWSGGLSRGQKRVLDRHVLVCDYGDHLRGWSTGYREGRALTWTGCADPADARAGGRGACDAVAAGVDLLPHVHRSAFRVAWSAARSPLVLCHSHAGPVWRGVRADPARRARRTLRAEGPSAPAPAPITRSRTPSAQWFLGRTPRQAYRVNFQMPSADFGVVLPRMSLLATIGFAYSVISPIINGLAMLSFALFFLAWKFRECGAERCERMGAEGAQC